VVSIEVITRLSETLKPLSHEQGANAAVSLLLISRRGDIELLLVKRVENPSDTWSGQMALPGGKREQKDRSLTDTVMRETLEETGVELNRRQFLGVLDVVHSKPKSDFKILPFVALLDVDPQLKLNTAELKRFIWVPYEEIVQNERIVRFSFGEVPAYIFAGDIVWGITYDILSGFIKAVETTQKKRDI
jgi:8-oxo-dGTP diphosphatase